MYKSRKVLHRILYPIILRKGKHCPFRRTQPTAQSCLHDLKPILLLLYLKKSPCDFLFLMCRSLHLCQNPVASLTLDRILIPCWYISKGHSQLLRHFPEFEVMHLDDNVDGLPEASHRGLSHFKFSPCAGIFTLGGEHNPLHFPKYNM